MSNITSNPPTYRFPTDSTVSIGKNGEACVETQRGDDVSMTTCFQLIPGMKLIFEDEADNTLKTPDIKNTTTDTGSTDQPSNQQLISSLIQMLQQLLSQIQGSSTVGGKS